MAIPIRTGVASPAGGRLSAQQLADLMEGNMGYAESRIPDPRADVQASVGQIPRQVPNPEVQRGIPILESEATIETPQDIADAGGSFFAPAAQQQPMIDPATGQQVINPETGERMWEDLGPSAYDQQLQREKASRNSVVGAIHTIAEDPIRNSRQGLADLFEGEQMAAQTGWALNARNEFKLSERAKTTSVFIEQAATDLGTAVKNSEEALFSRGTRSAILDDDGNSVPAGFKVMADSGIFDQQTIKVVATLAGLALSKATSQLGVAKSDGGDTAVTGDMSDSQSNIINSVRHHLVNGLTNTGIKLSQGGADMLAKSIVLHNTHDGNYIPKMNKATGKLDLEASPEFKRQSMMLERVAEAVAGETKRKGASSTPTHSGSSFTTGKPRMTKGAPNDLSYNTTAANATKSILGAVAQGFRPKDLKRKQIELEMVLGKEFREEDADGNFLYSTHPLAKKNGVHRGAYTAALGKVQRPLSFDANNQRHNQEFAKMQQEEAVKVMMEKEAGLIFDLQTAAKSTGVLYSEWIHSPSNQRFYPNSHNTDYMGSKAVIRDIMSLTAQDSVRAKDLFDPQALAILKRKASWLFKGHGLQVHKNLEALTPNEIGALGAMHNAVMYYYTALDSSVKNITKMPVDEALALYTPAIGARLAGIGEKYNMFLADPTIEPDNEMMALWAATEKGEALASLNLWDDFFKIKTMADNPKTAGHSTLLTHHSIDDGNQNGIFLQALFFGLKDMNASADSLLRTSVADPSMKDMRVFGMDTMVHHLQSMLHDNPEAQSAWAAFWAEAIANNADGMDGVAKDFFKVPLMQNSYGKDAAMFNDVLMEMIEANEDYSKLADKHLIETGVYRDKVAAGNDLTGAVEMSLRQLIDSGSVNMMKNIGRFTATINRPIVLPGITGDDLVIVPVGATPVNKEVAGSGNLVRKTLPDGTTVMLKKPTRESDTFVDPITGEQTAVDTVRTQTNVNATKGVQRFWNRTKQKWDEFHNALGTLVSRQFPVLMIQALDGDLVKSTAIEVNKERMDPSKKSAPRPVLFVHDSIISTPGQSLIYTNAYNNVAIPAAIPKIANMGKKIQDFVHLAESQEKARVINRGEPVGIGANGDYPSLGAIFDDYNNRIIEQGQPEDYAVGSINQPNDYKMAFLRRERTAQKARKKRKGSNNTAKSWEKRVEADDTFEMSPEGKWEKYRMRLISILHDARKHGWVPEMEMEKADAANLAVEAKDFAPLVELGAELLNMKNMKPWTNEFARRVQNAEKKLLAATRNGGIRQMSSSGGKAPDRKGYNPVPKGETPPPIPQASPGAIKPLDQMFDTNEPIPF